MRTSPFAEVHDELRTTLRRVVERELAPQARAWDEAGTLPDDLFPRLAALGVLGLSAPTELGGQGGDPWSEVVLVEELARAGSGSLTAVVGMLTAVVVPTVLRAATPAQQSWLRPILDGTRTAAAVSPAPRTATEPAATITARPAGDGWRLDGERSLLAGGTRADLLLVPARSADAGAAGPDGSWSLFLIDARAPGCAVRPLPAVGTLAAGRGMLHLDAVTVPDDALLGQPGEGGAHLRWQRARTWLVAAAASASAARHIFEQAAGYTRQREAFGRPIGRFQVVQHSLADLAARIEAAQALGYQAWDGHIRGGDDPEQIAAARLTAARLAFEVADTSLQLHGGAGYSRELDVERHWRDARMLRLSDDPDEEQLDTIADGLVRAHRPGAHGQHRRSDPHQQADVEPSALPLFGPEHHDLRSAARSFVEREIAPHVDRWEDEEDLPRELFRTVGREGFLGLGFAPAVGGSGPDPLAQAVWVEELARCLSGGVSADLGASSDLAAVYVHNAGTAEQHQRILPPLLRGERIGALAITEPGAGSDVAAITTRARRDGAGWVLHGAKVFITNGSWCDDVVVAAKVSRDDGAPSDDPHGMITLFHVRADDPGITRRRMRMLGWHTSHTGELTFDGVRLEDDRRLGAVGSGFGFITEAFAWERLVMSLGAVATAERTLELAVDEARDHGLVGDAGQRPAAWRHRLAELRARILAARALTEQALRSVVARRDGGQIEPVTVIRTAAMAKLSTQRMAFEVADECLQLLAGRAERPDHPIQRVWRDARLGPIGGGTDQIMRTIVARTGGW